MQMTLVEPHAVQSVGRSFSVRFADGERGQIAIILGSKD